MENAALRKVPSNDDEIDFKPKRVLAIATTATPMQQENVPPIASSYFANLMAKTPHSGIQSEEQRRLAAKVREEKKSESKRLKDHSSAKRTLLVGHSPRDHSSPNALISRDSCSVPQPVHSTLSANMPPGAGFKDAERHKSRDDTFDSNIVDHPKDAVARESGADSKNNGCMDAQIVAAVAPVDGTVDGTFLDDRSDTAAMSTTPIAHKETSCTISELPNDSYSPAAVAIAEADAVLAEDDVIASANRSGDGTDVENSERANEPLTSSPAAKVDAKIDLPTVGFEATAASTESEYSAKNVCMAEHIPRFSQAELDAKLAAARLQMETVYKTQLSLVSDSLKEAQEELIEYSGMH
jgi:hypothetical protein